MPLPIHIRFDGPPGPKSGRFIEVEQGTQSVKLGYWVQDGDDWLLVLPKPYVRLAAMEQLLIEVENVIGMARSFANFPAWLEQLEEALAAAQEEE